MLLEVSDIAKTFTIRQGWPIPRKVSVRALDGVSFSVDHGEALGVVGESGCGKSTAARVVLRLIEADRGRVSFDGEDVLAASPARMRALRRRMQIVFQDPASALDPRQRVGAALGEPLAVHGIARGDAARARIAAVLDEVGLPASAAERFPHEFSGGQRQRIGIARALALSPSFIVCDEPISALDVSIQAQVINLLEDLQKEMGLTYLFIAHDLSMVRHLADRVAVMYLGRLMEMADREELYHNPLHPYTQALFSAVPVPDPYVEDRRQRIILTGDPPSPANPPPGCPFNTRCPLAIDLCRQQVPEWRTVSPGHYVACHRV